MESQDQLPNKHRNNFDLKFFKRFFRLLPWLFPAWKSKPVAMFLFLLCIGLLEQVIIYHIGVIPSKYYDILGRKDHNAFWGQTAVAIALIVSEAFVKSTTVFASSYLYLIWREYITKRLHSKYFKEVLYYAVNVLNKTVDNPDQRIAQDVDKFCDTLSQIIAPIIISPFTIAYYIYKAQEGSGFVGPVGVLIFFIIATVINKLLMSPVVRFVFKREKMEGNFRFKHMQIRSNSESAAFYRSGCIEKQKSNRHLQFLISTQKKLIIRQYALNFSIYLFDYLGSIFSYIAIAFPIFVGAFDHLSSSQLSALISKNAFVVIYLINCFTKLIDLSVMVTKIAGTTHRIVELVEVLGKVEETQNTKIACRPNETRGFGWTEMEMLVENESANPKEESGRESPTHSGPRSAFHLSNVSYTAPGSSTKLCTGLSFSVNAGVNMLVTGDSGCGKSSLLRVINGIWPEVRGTIEHLVDLKPNVILFLPQRPYFTDGSLRQQIIYPVREFDESGKPLVSSDDEAIMAYLETCDLTHICARTQGLDTQVDWNWYDQLSPGEMQRLSFARLFYHKPKFAVLDEATSQIGVKAEHVMYTKCRDLGITLLSVGHRDSLRSYHQMELNIQTDGGWSLKPIPDSTDHGPSFGTIN